MLRSQAAKWLRWAPIVRYLCTFFPDDTADDVDSLCLGFDDPVTLSAPGGGTIISTDLSFCIYGDEAPDYWDTVWIAIRLAVTITFGWLAVAPWLPRPAIA